MVGWQKMTYNSQEYKQIYDGIRAVTIVRRDGTIVYENQPARDLLGHSAEGGSSLLPSLTTKSDWDEIQNKLISGVAIVDVPILLQTVHGDTDLCYLTVFPQLSENGELLEAACVWSVRKTSEDPAPDADPSEFSQYIHDLEKLIEHRTYQQVLAAEQNEFLSEVVDALPSGILVVSPEGDVVYRNRAMSDQYGLRTAEYGRPNIRYFLPRSLCDEFQKVVQSGLRTCMNTADPGGKEAVVEILPLERAGSTWQVVLHFSREEAGGARA